MLERRKCNFIFYNKSIFIIIPDFFKKALRFQALNAGQDAGVLGQHILRHIGQTAKCLLFPVYSHVCPQDGRSHFTCMINNKTYKYKKIGIGFLYPL